MKLPLLGLLLLGAARPVHAQNLFIVVENGVRYPVKAVVNKAPLIIVDGHPRAAQGQNFSLAKAPIFGLGVVDVGAFKVEITSNLNAAGLPQLHVYGRLKADTAQHSCFFVLRVNSDMGKSIICDALPDLAPGEDAVYDQLFDLPPRGLPGDGHFETLIFSRGLQLLTSRMAPAFVAMQRQRTLQYLQSHAAPR